LEAAVIRREVENGLWLFTQQNHAFLCGQLAQWWNSPQLNTSRQPCTFTEPKLDDHFVVSLHASNLYERRLRGGADSPENATRIQAFIQQQRNFQSKLQNELPPCMAGL
jgi:hypothetical protein